MKELPKKTFPWKKILIGVLALILLFYFGFKIFKVSTNLYRNWNEIKFAYQKGELVKSVREDYENKLKEADQLIINRGSTEKLIQEAAKKLKQEGLK